MKKLLLIALAAMFVSQINAADYWCGYRDAQSIRALLGMGKFAPNA